MNDLIKDLWPLLAIGGLILCTNLYPRDWSGLIKKVKTWKIKKSGTK